MTARTRFAPRIRRTSQIISTFALRAFALAMAGKVSAQDSTRTIVAVLAHADDEAPIGPILARYAREGVHVHIIIASDGMQGAGSNGFIPRADSGPRGEDLVRARTAEAQCSAQAIGATAPILLGFPDGKLGDWPADRSLLYRLTARLAEELARLKPDVVVTWGPDGGTGHPDHRLVSGIVTQLVRANAPGVPQRLFYMNLPPEAFTTMNAQRGVPPLLLPDAKYFTMRVAYTPGDLESAQRAMACHRSQYTPEVLQRIVAAQARVMTGSIGLIPAFATAGGTDLFH